MTPGETKNGSTVWLVERVRPSRSVAKSEHLERTHCEVVSIWSPLDARNDVVIRRRVIKLSTVLIPNSVLAIFTARNDQIVGRVPVTPEDYSIMGFPLGLFVSWESWKDSQHLLRSVEDRIVFWAPAHAIDSFAAVDDLRSECTSSRPYFDLTIFSSSGKGGTFITPFDRNNC